MRLFNSKGVSTPSLTKVFATLDPANKSTNTNLYNGNLTTITDGGGVKSTVSVTEGKWYFEVTLNNSSGFFGIATANANIYSYPGSDAYGAGYYQAGAVYVQGSSTSGVPTFKSGDIIGVAFDVGAGTVSWYKNGVFVITKTYSFTGAIYAMIAYSTNASVNFGASAFSYPVPTTYSLGLYEMIGPPLPNAVLNPLDKHTTVILSNKNLTAAISSTGMVRANIGKTSGQWYFEVKINTLGSCSIGVAANTVALTASPGSVNGSFGFRANGDFYKDGVLFSRNPVCKVGDVIGIKYTPSGGQMRLSINGVDQFGMSAVAGGQNLFPAVGSYGGATNLTCNFGATPFKYPQPSPYDVGVIL